jgi:hypothetical protein
MVTQRITHPQSPVARNQADPRALRAKNRAHLRLLRIDDADRTREDALPEHADYRDTGCDLAPSCLRCPFEQCKYDLKRSERTPSTLARDREIVLLRQKYRAPIHMLCQTYGLSRRSVFRILRAAREE